MSFWGISKLWTCSGYQSEKASHSEKLKSIQSNHCLLKLICRPHWYNDKHYLWTWGAVIAWCVLGHHSKNSISMNFRASEARFYGFSSYSNTSLLWRSIWDSLPQHENENLCQFLGVMVSLCYPSAIHPTHDITFHNHWPWLYFRPSPFSFLHSVSFMNDKSNNYFDFGANFIFFKKYFFAEC